MIRLPLFTYVLLIGLSMAIAKNDVKFRKIHANRFSQDNEQIRTLRNLMGKLIDTETNTIYNVNGQRQEDTPLITDSTTTPAAPLSPKALPNREEIACLAACHSCVDDYSFESRKKKAADNCGPMCDCADSCFLMSVDQVGKIYEQNANIRNDKNCWWRIYSEMLSDELPL